MQMWSLEPKAVVLDSECHAGVPERAATRSRQGPTCRRIFGPRSPVFGGHTVWQIRMGV